MKKLIIVALLVAATAGFAATSIAAAPPKTAQTTGVPSTPGGGAPASPDGATVECNLLLGLKLTKSSTADMKAVTFTIPAGHPGAYDIYFPVVDNYQDILRMGGDIAKVQVCDTPVGQMIDIVTKFNDQGAARALLPSDVGDGFQVLLVDSQHAFHAANYTGAEDALQFN